MYWGLPLRCFFYFTTQLHSYLCNHNAIFFIYRQEGSRGVLQQELSQPPILPSSQFLLVAIPLVRLLRLLYEIKVCKCISNIERRVENLPVGNNVWLSFLLLLAVSNPRSCPIPFLDKVCTSLVKIIEIQLNQPANCCLFYL